MQPRGWKGLSMDRTSRALDRWTKGPALSRQVRPAALPRPFPGGGAVRRQVKHVPGAFRFRAVDNGPADIPGCPVFFCIKFQIVHRASTGGRSREGCELKTDWTKRLDYLLKTEWAESLRQRMHGQAESLGNLLVEAFHYLALFAIGGATSWAALQAFAGMLDKGHVTVDDILLLFIYLELGAMVGIYFKTNHMPIRFLIYVAITALTRLMIGDISHSHTPGWGELIVSGAILLLAVANLVVRYASSRFPAEQADGPERRRIQVSEKPQGENA